ncbi:hypothetical protein, conserved [Leishmania tarentolae]|uniref:PH domain-containing protein n=1 Tax=Leishmania tarentolae TaxID=5689 RepID=A0A640KQZ0_LEITA|nr:hypothetical protein, conserved [Leishmania tarentolae]
MSTALEVKVEKLMLAAQEECRLMAAQLERSCAARAASTSGSRGKTPVTPAIEHEAAPSPSSTPRADIAATTTGPVKSFSIGFSTSNSPDRTRSPPASPPTTSPARVVIPTAATHKEGTLLHLVRGSGLFGNGSRSFVPHYIVVSGSSGISWYASEAEYHQNPSRPLGHANFWIETFNSRGSRFKKAAVCWPLILPDDCPEAKDATKTYFAVDYYTPNEGREQVLLGASSPAERDEWVNFLTKYIDLYLAPRAESEELQHIPRGAEVPLHRSGVIEGEAPGGNIL